MRHRTDHLLTVASRECDGASWRIRLPSEDRDEDGGRAVPVDPTALEPGGVGAVYVFQCRARPDRPFAHGWDCG
ncbi:hypothetical protein ACGFYY_23720 [Streptomyces sp. NPDC048331]|uniref:hypothetical protein n=1 Tax=Streptomyces sp. NPDC048331 TaxID=3365534 RepID=UPI00370F95B6